MDWEEERLQPDDLKIMKDSHIGTYGVLGLIVYNLLIYCTLLSGYEHIHWMVFLIFDPGCKAISTQIINILPYARPVEQSKIQTVYQRISLISSLRAIFIGFTTIIIVVYVEYYSRNSFFSCFNQLCTPYVYTHFRSINFDFSIQEKNWRVYGRLLWSQLFYY